MNLTKIDWPWKPLYTWNPAMGCQHNCSYCYAKRINDRFKWIPKWDEPKFFQERLLEPRDKKQPTNIFVCSMADLFGDWVPKNWISSVILSAHYNPQHSFLFLTKNPRRYSEFEFPENCWLGITMTQQEDLLHETRFLMMKKNRKFISAEPLLGTFKDADLSKLDLIIVGAMTGKNAVVPKREWVDSIKHPNIYYKENLRKIFPDLKNN